MTFNSRIKLFKMTLIIYENVKSLFYNLWVVTQFYVANNFNRSPTNHKFHTILDIRNEFPVYTKNQ